MKNKSLKNQNNLFFDIKTLIEQRIILPFQGAKTE